MSITFLSTPEDVTPGTTGWTTVDSANLPGSATGVIVRVRGDGGSTAGVEWGARHGDSTDDRHADIVNSTSTPGVAFAYVGVNSGQDFDLYLESTGNGIVFELMGYFESEASWKTNGVDKEPASTGFQDVDISSDTGAETAVAAFVELIAPSINSEAYLRTNSSTTDPTGGGATDVDNHQFHIVGVDESEIYEQYTENLSRTDGGFLIGWLTDGITWRTNSTSLSTATSFTDRTFNASAIAGIFTNSFASNRYSFCRKKGSSEDLGTLHSDNWCTWVVETDGSGVGQYKNSSTFGLTIFDAGYFTSVGGATTKTKTATLSGRVRDTLTKTSTLNSVIQLQGQTKATTLNAQVRDTFTKTATLNGVVLQLGKTLVSTLNGLVRQLGFTKTATLNAQVVSVITKSAVLNGIVKWIGKTATATLNGLVQDTLTKSAVLNGAIQAVFTLTSTFSGVIRDTFTKTATLNAQIQVTNTKTAVLNAIIGAAPATGTYIPYPRRRRR